MIQEGKCAGLLPETYTEVNSLILLNDMRTAIKNHSLDRQKDLWAWFRGSWIAMEEKFYEHIAKLSTSHGIILDAFVIDQGQFDRMHKWLKDCCFLVFVHVPLETIIDRIISRNASGDHENRRSVDRVLSTYPEHYIAASGPVVLDAPVSHEIIEAVVAKGETLHHEGAPLPQGAALVELMKIKFNVTNESLVVYPQPKWQHDFLVDTSLHAPETAAAEILSVLDKK
jgi:hypothetical protein